MALSGDKQIENESTSTKVAAEQWETLGSLLESKEFQGYLVSFPVFFIILVSLIWGDFFNQLSAYSVWATSGLVVANYLGTISVGAFLFSWILVDQCSWLSRAIIFLAVGIFFLVSTNSLMIIMASSKSANDQNDTLTFTVVFGEDSNNSSLQLSKANSIWIQALICLNLFQGVFCLIFFLCLCAVMDTSNLI